MTKTMTYPQALEIAIASVDGEAKERLEALQATMAKKKSNKKSVDNSPFYAKVEEALAGGAKTPTELMKLIDVANTQKVSAIVKTMPNVKREVKGKKVTYSLEVSAEE